MTLFLELVRQLLDPAKYRAMLLPELHWFPADLASSLATTGGLADLRQHIMSWVSGKSYNEEGDVSDPYWYRPSQ